MTNDSAFNLDELIQDLVQQFKNHRRISTKVLKRLARLDSYDDLYAAGDSLPIPPMEEDLTNQCYYFIWARLCKVIIDSGPITLERAICFLDYSTALEDVEGLNFTSNRDALPFIELLDDFLRPSQDIALTLKFGKLIQRYYDLRKERKLRQGWLIRISDLKDLVECKIRLFIDECHIPKSYEGILQQIQYFVVFDRLGLWFDDTPYRDLIIMVGLEWLYEEDRDLDKVRNLISRMEAIGATNDEVLHKIEVVKFKYRNKIVRHYDINPLEAYYTIQVHQDDPENVEIKNHKDLNLCQFPVLYYQNSNPQFFVYDGKLVYPTKVIPLTVKEYVSSKWENIKVYLKEAKIFKKISAKHSFFPRFYGLLVNGKQRQKVLPADGHTKRGKSFISIAIERRLNNLMDVLVERKRGEVFNKKEILAIIRDLLEGFSELHKNKVFHLDIKPQKIYLSEDKTFKVGDFNVRDEIEEDPVSIFYQNETIQPPIGYFPPEFINRQFTSVSQMNIDAKMKADVYALGLTILQCASLKSVKFLAKTKKQNKLDEMIESLKFKPVKKILKKMLAFDPNERPLMKDLAESLSRKVQAYPSISEFYPFNF